VTLAILLLPLPLSAQQEVPEGARGHFKAGVALIEKANKPADFLAAVSEFEAAAALAPQWPDIHYNLAKLAAEVDKPAKAIKEYRTYLTLVPAAADKAVVDGEMVRMKELIARKRKIGLPGVKFVAMADGIGVLQLFPGSRIGKAGLEVGCKIVAINGNSVVGYTLENFFKVTESVRWEDDRGRARSLAGRRGSYEGPVMALAVIKAGERIPILIHKSMFQSNVIEIEEEEFESEVLKESLPVVVTFWTSECEPCRQFVPVVEAESSKYAGKIKFVNVNVDENMALTRDLKIKGVPTMMVYKGGKLVSADTGMLGKERVSAILSSAAAQ
jgi:thioredoxin 1